MVGPARRREEPAGRSTMAGRKLPLPVCREVFVVPAAVRGGVDLTSVRAIAGVPYDAPAGESPRLRWADAALTGHRPPPGRYSRCPPAGWRGSPWKGLPARSRLALCR